MSQTQQDTSDTLIALLDRSECSPEVIRHNTETSTIIIHANNTTSVSAYGTTIPLNNCENNNVKQSRDFLKSLIFITNICLIIGAVIIVVSLCITFSTVGLAIVRMYVEGIPKPNVTRRRMPRRHELY